MTTGFVQKTLNRVLGPVATTANERVQETRGAGVVALLFLFALLGEIAMTDPGAPLRMPGVVEALSALLIALGIAAIGYAIEVRTWQLRPARASSHTQFALYAGMLGVAVGLVVLVQNLLLISIDPGLRPRYSLFVGEPWWPPLLRAFTASVTEEVLFRYIGMGAVTVIAFRRLGNANRAYRIAMLCTAIIFGVLHYHGLSLSGIVIVLVNTGAALIFGWIYWHWGLRYAILCHFMGGLVNQSLGPRLLG